jgi:hypothetical protein
VSYDQLVLNEGVAIQLEDVAGVGVDDELVSVISAIASVIKWRQLKLLVLVVFCNVQRLFFVDGRKKNIL